jgi:hypothetical protein
MTTKTLENMSFLSCLIFRSSPLEAKKKAAFPVSSDNVAAPLP